MGWEMPWYSARDSADALLGEFGGYACYLRDGDRVFVTYWTTSRGCEAGATSYHLLDLTVYGRQELWEDSPDGWPPAVRMTFTASGNPTTRALVSPRA
jgi:predicted dithiol-disulfide oxidoreductase (DUF899 family)